MGSARAQEAAVAAESPGPCAIAPRPSWWDRHFMVQYGHSVTVLCLKLKALSLSDTDVVSICLALDSFLLRTVDPRLPIAIEVDASDNKLTDRGGVHLVAWLCALVSKHFAGVHVRIIKLYKNQIADDTCDALAALILALSEPVEEIHLSHNEIEQRGLVVLLGAIAMHPGHIYPRQARNHPCPCWVRMEHNKVMDTEELLSGLAAQPVGLRYCLAKRSDKGPSCTSFQCCVNTPTWEDVAHVHLYCVHVQSLPSSFIREKPKKLISQVTASIADAKLPCYAISSKTSKGHVATPMPSDAVVIRTVLLRVDKEYGAGIELEPGAHGYIVQSVDTTPGQDLKPGDVITAIDGVPLWGSLEMDELNAAFGSRFGNDAQLSVAAEIELAGRSLWQPLDCGSLEVGSRCEAFLSALREDLGIMGHRCGARAELHAQDGAVTLRGPPQSQRWAVHEMLGLLGFYFPECVGAAALPPSYWHGGPDPLCAVQEETEEVTTCPVAHTREPAGVGADADVSQVKDLGTWESALKKQWSEDDDIFDADLPCEPLEAPDEGPDMFDGEALVPDFDALFLPLRVLMLVGLPGSGKSTLAARLWDLGWRTVNQDTLGDRRACVASARKALSAGKRVVIDRCNISRLQRRVWLGIADELEVCAGCIWLDVDQTECGQRVLQRFGHPTLPAESSSLGVISAFQDRLEAPVEAEGFVLWRTRCQDQLDSAIEEIQELADRSEADYAEASASREARDRWEKRTRVPEQVDQLDSVPSGGFRYREVRGRGARGIYLRGVRRQVEYYFPMPIFARIGFSRRRSLKSLSLDGSSCAGSCPALESKTPTRLVMLMCWNLSAPLT